MRTAATGWRDLVAGSEGFLTGRGRAGFEGREVVWGDMDVMVSFWFLMSLLFNLRFCLLGWSFTISICEMWKIHVWALNGPMGLSLSIHVTLAMGCLPTAFTPASNFLNGSEPLNLLSLLAPDSLAPRKAPCILPARSDCGAIAH